MEELILKKSGLKLPEVNSEKLTSAELFITPAGTEKLIPASWGYFPIINNLNDKDAHIPSNKIFNVDYLNLKNLPQAGHERAGYCKVWVLKDSKVKAVRGYYFYDSNESYSVCLITDNSNLIYI